MKKLLKLNTDVKSCDFVFGYPFHSFKKTPLKIEDRVVKMNLRIQFKCKLHFSQWKSLTDL